MRFATLLAGSVLLGGCSLPGTVARLEQESPPPELGRPVWVTAPARFGSWVGGIGGGLVSVVFLPVTWPISLAAEEPLGYSRDEFLFAPVGAGAGLGHVALGAPVDAVDWMLRRGWTTEEPLAQYEDYAPQQPPAGPAAAPPSAADLPANPEGDDAAPAATDDR